MDVRRFVAFFCVEEELASGFSVDRRHERTLPCKRDSRSEEHTSELQSPCNLVCRLLLEKKTTQCERRAQRRISGICQFFVLRKDPHPHASLALHCIIARKIGRAHV